MVGLDAVRRFLRNQPQPKMLCFFKLREDLFSRYLCYSVQGVSFYCIEELIDSLHSLSAYKDKQLK